MAAAHAQTFVICAISIALTAGPVGFELGAYGTLFVSHMFQSLLLVTAALLAMVVLPATSSRHRNNPSMTLGRWPGSSKNSGRISLSMR